MGNYLSYLNEYKKDTQKNKSKTNSFDLKNYFNTYLPDGVNKQVKNIRILKYNVEDNKFWGEMYTHKKEVEPKKWRTFTCIKHEKGEECPFCETRKMLLETGKDSDKELAKKFSSRKMFVLKIIDRDKEHEGVKFWRFNKSYDNTGILDKILSTIEAVEEDIVDYNTGRDLKIEIKRNHLKRPVVDSVNYSPKQSKLSDDQTLMEEWSNDTKTWEDVYAVKDYNYLSIIVMGKTPTWSKEQEKFVAKEDETTSYKESKDDYESELTMGNTNKNIETSSETEEIKKKSDDDFDDLPF